MSIHFRELHESACVAKHWSLVRHTHGLLGKKVMMMMMMMMIIIMILMMMMKIQNMDLSCTDLLVRQKQVTIGLPPNNEVGEKRRFRVDTIYLVIKIVFCLKRLGSFLSTIHSVCDRW